MWGIWRPWCCDSLFCRFVRLCFLPAPHVWEVIGNEKPGQMPRRSRLFNEDWTRGIQALACALARVGPRRETQVCPRRSDGRPPSRLAFPLFGRAAESHMCVLALSHVRDYMTCVKACANVCGCWKTRYLERWGLMTFVSSDTQGCSAVDGTGVFSDPLWVYLKEVLLFQDDCGDLFLWHCARWHWVSLRHHSTTKLSTQLIRFLSGFPL